jgi:hypothetical protein
MLTKLEVMEYLGRMRSDLLLGLARDRVPGALAEDLCEMGVVYDYNGDSSLFRLSVFGQQAVAHAVNARGLVGKAARPAVVTDDERQERKVRAIADRKNARRAWLAEQRAARSNAVLEEAKRMAQMLTRGLEVGECVSCGCEIEFKQLRIFDRSKRYECTICGLRVRPKKVPRDPRAGRLPVISIHNGFGAVVCFDCVEYCSSCWTKPTYKHIMKVYGVDLRD